MTKTIAIIGTLDTKGEEIKYVKELIENRGHRTIVIDGGVLGEPHFPPDFTHEEVARAGGMDLKEIIALGDETQAIAAMAEGASRIARQLYSEGRLDGIIAVGGSTGASLALPVMKALPLLLPKLLVAVAILSAIPPEVMSKDVTLMPPVADFWGLGRITKEVLENAAGAIVGMVEARQRTAIPEKPLIGITTLGTAVCKHVLWAKPLLEQKGYDMVVFPGFGTNFEEVVEEGMIGGALDFMAAYQLTNEACGGANKPGPIRFEAGRKRGIPQVFAPAAAGCIWQFGPLQSLPPQFEGRIAHQHGLIGTLVKANKEEMSLAGEMMAQELNEMSGATAMLIPSQGFDEWDKPGEVFYDPEGRRAFIEALKGHIEPKVKVLELDVHLNDPAFAEEAVAILDEMMKGG